MTIKLETQTIRDIGTFERMTKVHVKDCIRDDNCVYFMVESGKSGIAIGRNGSIIKNVSRVLGKTVKVFEFSEKPEEMVKSMIPSAKSVDVMNDSVNVTIPASDRSVVIGRNGRNIKVMKEFLNRHFKINYLRLK
ncbi:MAG: NusA-like transcription termination signal-binding factor [Candidatus Aenigmarchaeota archaeon]|nr:NusA-like transcription termination signal-binding factor [Candidatus Aenigmarchaeota archaeon]